MSESYTAGIITLLCKYRNSPAPPTSVHTESALLKTGLLESPPPRFMRNTFPGDYNITDVQEAGIESMLHSLGKVSRGAIYTFLAYNALRHGIGLQ
jgi:hypothetical protein